MSRKKLIIILLVAAAILAGVLAYLFYHDSNSKKQASQTNAAQKDTTKRTTSLTPSAGTNKSAGDTSSGNSVDTGTVPAPDNNANYPILNAHYKISQQNASTYDITLYAISNSPSQYDEYINQLKQYKQEALAYLTNRYGDISHFTINWDPPNAKTL